MDIDIDITKTPVETDRLILRAWRETDLEDLYEYASVEGVGEMAGWLPHASIEVSRGVLEGFMAGKNVFAITLRENGKVIGSLGLHNSWANDDPQFADLKLKEIGYILAKPYWGKGLMTEAVRAVINFCFTNLGMDAVSCGHLVINGRSKRVIEKCGFKYVKTTEYYSKQMEKSLGGDAKYILLKNSPF